MLTRWQRIDRRIEHGLYVFGHYTHAVALALVFIWFGALKVLGASTATSIIATTVYFGDPAQTVPLLGAWEIAIGACLLLRRLHRVALLLLAIRLPGTMLALILRADVCFVEIPFVPTIAGQYLIKDLLLFTVAAVVGGYVSRPPHRLRSRSPSEPAMPRRNIASGAPWEPIAGYSRAVRVGPHVHVAGTTATTADGIEGVGDPYAQTKRAIANIAEGLARAGASLDDVVRTRIYVTDIAHWEEVACAHAEAFGAIRPASTLVEVRHLVAPELLVEIEADAYVEDVPGSERGPR